MSSSAQMELLAKLQKENKITLEHYLAMVSQLADAQQQDAGPCSLPRESSAAAAEAADEQQSDGEADVDAEEEVDDESDDDDGDEAAEEDAAEAESERDAKRQKRPQASILNFIRANAPPDAKVSAPRKPPLATHKKKKKLGNDIAENRNIKGRGASLHKNGVRKNDVRPQTLAKRIAEFPDESLIISQGQIFCVACGKNIASGAQPCKDHCARPGHIEAKLKLESSQDNRVDLKHALHDFKELIKVQHGDDAQVKGLEKVPVETQLARAECLEVLLRAGIEPLKIDKIRPYLERFGVSLTGAPSPHCHHTTQTVKCVRSSRRCTPNARYTRHMRHC